MYHVMSRGDRREKIFLDDVEFSVHLNPLRARMLKSQGRLLSYPWSSFGAYMAAPEHRPSWVRVDWLLGEHGMQEDTPTSRAQFEQWMERRRLEETDPEALKSQLAQLHARGRCRQRWPGATGHMTNGAARNDPSYGLTPLRPIQDPEATPLRSKISPIMGLKRGVHREPPLLVLATLVRCRTDLLNVLVRQLVFP
jgi:hypothetical protein